jgi:hypothetical protein
MSCAVRIRLNQEPHRSWRRNRYEGVVMTKLVMMWLFGVPVSVLLLFMAFGMV